MSNVKVIDKGGKWFMNTALFRFVDSTDPARVVILEPGVPTKVKETEWIKSQPTIVACPDPMGDEGEMPTVVVPLENTLVPLDPETGVPAPEAAPGVLETTRTGQRRK